MNCKPNQLAMVVRGDEARTKACIGKTTRVKSRGSVPAGIPAWNVEEFRVEWIENGLRYSGDVTAIADSLLMPIDEPGLLGMVKRVWWRLRDRLKRDKWPVVNPEPKRSTESQPDPCRFDPIRHE